MKESGGEAMGGGSSRPRNRKRAVRLTDQALTELKGALLERWQKDESGIRLTREARAHLLGVSVATSDRIINQQGVDRNTLTHVYKSIGLSWDDSRCEYVVSAEEEEQAAVVVAPVVFTQTPPKPRRWRFLVAAAGLLVALTLLGPIRQEVAYRMDKARLDALGETFRQKSRLAAEHFQQGNYAAAEAEIERATAIARRVGNAEQLAVALRTAADIAEARGSLAEAKELYQRTLELRQSLDDPRCLPPLLEAIGDVETRTGDLVNAEHHLSESLVGYQSTKDAGGIAMAYRGLGSVAFQKGDLDKASRMFASALAALRGKDAADMVVDIEARKALVLRERGRHKEALRVLNSCLDHWVQRGHPRWIAKTRYQIGTVEAAAENQPNARQILANARQGYITVGDAAGVADCDRELQQLDLQASSVDAVSVVE